MDDDPIKNLLTRLCRAVVKHASDFEILPMFEGETLSKWRVRVNHGDIPRLMGKKGSRFHGLQVLTKAAGLKVGRLVQLERMEDAIKGESEIYPKFRFNPSWPKEEIEVLLSDVCNAVLRHPADVNCRRGKESAVFVIHYDEREPGNDLLELCGALAVVFEGIGTTNGCRLSIDMQRIK